MSRSTVLIANNTSAGRAVEVGAIAVDQSVHLLCLPGAALAAAG
jgi:hypothetical protein